MNKPRPFDREAFRYGLAQLREALPDMLESFAVRAQLTRMKYNALLKEGFTEAQAIELCRTNSLID